MTIEERVKEIQSCEWVIAYCGTCCDTGKFSRTYRFKTYIEAQDFYADWLKATVTGHSWSDGPDYMELPVHVSELEAG